MAKLESITVGSIVKGLVKKIPQVKRKISEIPEADREVLRQLLHLLVGSGNKTLKLMFSEKKD